jgi:hypothetical protein
MEKQRSILKNLLAIFTALMLILMIGCKDSPVDVVDNSQTNSDQEALQKIADEDSSLASFETNFNDEDLMSFAKVSTDIYPFRVGHKVRLVNRNLNIEFQGDSAIGTLTKTYEGVLLIAASYSDTSSVPDTIIQKPFTTTVTRKLIFIKVAKTDRPLLNWKIAAISLPEGGTGSANIQIQKVIVSIDGQDDLVIESPTDNFLNRWKKWWREIPVLHLNQPVKIQVEVKSAYADTDFVTLTYGADLRGFHRAKKRFELVSSTPDGNGFYTKVYEQSYTANPYRGFFHAVINAFPSQVIFDDAAPVETSMWGIPYIVKF